jgi:hypothetical protein
MIQYKLPFFAYKIFLSGRLLICVLFSVLTKLALFALALLALFALALYSLFSLLVSRRRWAYRPHNQSRLKITDESFCRTASAPRLQRNSLSADLLHPSLHSSTSQTTVNSSVILLSLSIFHKKTISILHSAFFSSLHRLELAF